MGVWGLDAWAVSAGLYGLLLAAAAITQPIRRRRVALAAAACYTAVAVVTSRVADAVWVDLVVPGGLLLSGYWLSGLFFRDPQNWLEAFLLRVDRSLGAGRWMSYLPRPVGEVLELSYAADYLVVGGGAIYAATFGSEAVTYYWNLVLSAELASFAPLPWLRSRPPRAIERSAHTTRLYLRRLNIAILDRASVQANTMPSGHVSGAVAAALGVMAVDVVTGGWLMVTAGLIAVAAAAGRYHYVVDCVAGVMVALAFWSLM